jgi:hypothetical protein
MGIPSYNIITTLRHYAPWSADGVRRICFSRQPCKANCASSAGHFVTLSLSGSQIQKRYTQLPKVKHILMWVSYETIRKHPLDFHVQYRFYTLKKVVDEIFLQQI